MAATNSTLVIGWKFSSATLARGGGLIPAYAIRVASCHLLNLTDCAVPTTLANATLSEIMYFPKLVADGEIDGKVFLCHFSASGSNRGDMGYYNVHFSDDHGSTWSDRSTIYSQAVADGMTYSFAVSGPTISFMWATLEQVVLLTCPTSAIAASVDYTNTLPYVGGSETIVTEFSIAPGPSGTFLAVYLSDDGIESYMSFRYFNGSIWEAPQNFSSGHTYNPTVVFDSHATWLIGFDKPNDVTSYSDIYSQST